MPNENYTGNNMGYEPNIPINNNDDFMNKFNPRNYISNSNFPENNLNNDNKKSSPGKIFSNYYLNNTDPNNIDNGYSKKKNYLMKDFYSKEKLDRDEFVK